MSQSLTQLRRQKPVRRSRHRRSSTRRRGLSWRVRGILFAGAFAVACLAWAILARLNAPTGNTVADRMDAIIVLGSPADSEGNPKPAQLPRITEGVHEYERGVAPRLILTGGAAHNQYVEAKVMARVAEAQGVPAPALILEPQAHNTLQNACFATRIMKDHGWHSAEIVGPAYQLPRAALIFSRLPIDWRTHVAPPLEPVSSFTQEGYKAIEILKTVNYLLFTRWAETCSL